MAVSTAWLCFTPHIIGIKEQKVLFTGEGKGGFYKKA
jgi:hypothetical protein